MTTEEQVTPKTPKNTFSQHLGMFFFHVFEKCLSLVPMYVLCKAGRMVGFIVYCIFPGRRRIVARNLRIVMDTRLRGKELNTLVKENFKRTVANLIGSAKTATLSEAQLEKCVRIENHDVFTAGGRGGRGTVCCIPHSGNWEILARIRTFFKEVEHFGSMYRQMDNPLMEEYLYKRRTERGTCMFSKESGIKAPLKFLKELGSLGVLSDQFVQEGVFVPYFRKVAGTTYLPALMYKRTKAALIAVGVYTERPGYWVADMGEPIDPESVDSSIAGITIAVNRKMEEILRKSPLDGFWMHHRWKVLDAFVSSDEKTNRLLEGMDLIPFRILFACPESLEEAILSVPLMRALKAARCDIQVIALCRPEQETFWQELHLPDKVVAFRDARELAARLDEPELYDDGPYDMAFLLDGSEETVKGLLPFMPLTFSGFDNHPSIGKVKFRVKSPYRDQKEPDRPRILDYMALAEAHSIPNQDPSLFPSLHEGYRKGKGEILLAPFSNRVSGEEWPVDLWKRLVAGLDSQCRLVALDVDDGNARTLAAEIDIPVTTGNPGILVAAMQKASCVIAVDGLFPAMASHAGIPSVTLADGGGDRRYEPYGDFHEVVRSDGNLSLLEADAVLAAVRRLKERLPAIVPHHE